ncbi:hypothetical protein GYMLUDRAFT_166708, partial [Collybiopsis luxurians FD-317 M1]
TFGEFVMYILNPNLGLGTAQWHDFAIIPGQVIQILNWWNSTKNPKSVCNELNEWAVKHVCSCLAKQAQHVTREGKLKMAGRAIDKQLVLLFSFENIFNYL